MASVISGQLIGRLSSKTSFTRVEYTTNDCMAWNFFFIAVQCFFKIKGLNLPLDFMFTCPNYEIATYIVKYKFAQSCKSKVAGSVSLRYWPEVLLFSVVVRAGYDIKRSNPLSSARTLSSEGLVLRHSWPRAPRNLRSIAHRTGETVQIFR